MRTLLALLALSAPSWAAANAPAPATPMDAFRAHVADLSHSAVDPFTTDAVVWHKAQTFFTNVPGTVIHVEPGLRGWDFGREALGDGKEVSLADLMTHGRERITDLKGDVPAPNELLKKSVEAATNLHASKKVSVDEAGELDASTMGALHYVKGMLNSARIQINRVMPAVMAYIGKAFGYATVAHEGRHLLEHLEGRLSPDDVIKGEVAAFRTQFDWIVHADPRGERLVFARAALRNHIRDGRGGDAAVASLKVLDHLADVRATDGDERKLTELVHKLGYAEGHDHDHGHPAPVRN